MWRSEEIGLEQAVGLFRIGDILIVGVPEAADVVERVVADAVAAADDHFVQIRIFPHVVAHHEESGFYTVAV